MLKYYLQITPQLCKLSKAVNISAPHLQIADGGNKSLGRGVSCKIQNNLL